MKKINISSLVCYFRFASLLIFCFTLSVVNAQDLTGTWQGNFISDLGEKYKIEVQLKNNGKIISGVTYSYLTTVFYAKASMTGSLEKTGSRVIMNETKLTVVKMADMTDACIMKYDLVYSKSGNEEIMEGTYTSKYEKDGYGGKKGENCGGGRVTLRKVPSSDADFPVESFLKPASKKQDSPIIEKNANGASPKLVVGIVIDQMRFDYLSRFWNKYGKGGFKKLVTEGFNCKNTHYNYVPTYTAPGHASIYSGTTPAVHGIISNSWFDKKSGKTIYCVEDTSVKPVGTASYKGKMSPKRLLVTSIADQLRLHTMSQSKTFGIALKERSAILPAGHSANAAFWFDGSTGGFVSSSHYLNELPAWLNDFNSAHHASSYLKNGWKTLLPIEQYTESCPDNSPYESSPLQPEKPFFPYDLSAAVSEKKFDLIAYTPYGNSITKDLAMACISAEKLGKDNACDLLCVSFSSPDIIGHAYGIRAVEIEDVYLRLDKDLEEIITFLEKEIGKDNFSVFLTADHGGAENTLFLKDNKIPSGTINASALEKGMRTLLKNEFGDSLVLSYSNQQIFLNQEVIQKKQLNKSAIFEKISLWLLQQPGISEVYEGQKINTASYNQNNFQYLVQRGYNMRLSGDFIVNYLPAWMEHEEKGTTHGAPYSYDTHVPLLFYGAGFKKGESLQRFEITQIAPTLSQLLNIEYPNGCTANPISEVLNK